MLRRLLAVSACALCLGTGAAAAQRGAPPPASAQPRSGDTYLWHGELVSVDGASRTLTARVRVLSEAASDVGRFGVGDRVLLAWSGLDVHAGAVRRVTRYDAGQQILDFFALPVELASRDVQGEYMTVRVRIPEAAVAAVKGRKPGEWLTVTTRQRPKADADAIVAVGVYAKPPA